MEPFEALLDFVGEQDRLIGIYSSSLRAAQGYGELVDALRATGRSSHDDEDVERAKKFESECGMEVENGFPLLVSHSIIVLWASLESSIPEFVKRVLVHYPSLSNEGVFNKLRVSPLVALMGTREDVSSFILDELERSSHVKSKWGPARFDAMLESVSVVPNVSSKCRRDLIELSQIRNLIAHKRGIVDAKFLTACPWLSAEIGTPVSASVEDYGRYRSAVLSYAAELIKSAVAIENAKRFER
jgi:hypothetical protein